MVTHIKSAAKPDKSAALIIIADKKTNWKKSGLRAAETEIVLSQHKAGVNHISIPEKNNSKFIFFTDSIDNSIKNNEALRKAGATLCGIVNKQKISSVFISNTTAMSNASLLLAEGMALANYQFLIHVTDKKNAYKLSKIAINAADASKEKTDELNTIIEAANLVRDLVNEPVNYLNAVQLAEAFSAAGKVAGFSVKILDKKKIVEMKMGGLLSVNQGSIDPPTFTIMEYKPENAVNKKPIVLIGKGVVYDTGGLSIKPTGNSMDYMKCDMAGAATQMGVIYSVAKNKLPLHVIALTPATDNRLNGNAFAPGDIITMYSGATVEMLNSDAEGRMILADALTYSNQYEPELVIDMATLTGAVHRALGDYAIGYMGTADDSTKKNLEESGLDVYERLVHFPLWDEYGDMLKSDIADFKNIGGALAGQITAGKFLEKFTDYPWIHLDIAGMAFFNTAQGYKTKGSTAVGLRLVYNFLKKRIS